MLAINTLRWDLDPSFLEKVMTMIALFQTFFQHHFFVPVTHSHTTLSLALALLRTEKSSLTLISCRTETYMVNDANESHRLTRSLDQ